MDNEIRLFIAIELPDDIRKGLGAIQNSLKNPAYSSVKWVSPQSIHLTLKFLGNIKHDTVDSIVKAIKSGCQSYHCFHLEIAGLGTFPNNRIPRVVWIGLNGDLNTLISLQQNIDEELLPLGYGKEKRPFSPHVTLARINERALSQERRSIGETISKVINTDIFKVEVQSVNLMRSQLLPGGAVYTQLACVELGN